MLKCVNIPNVAASAEKKVNTRCVRSNPSLMRLGVKKSQPKNLSKKMPFFCFWGKWAAFPQHPCDMISILMNSSDYLPMHSWPLLQDFPS
jgi:hypothetical protein